MANRGTFAKSALTLVKGGCFVQLAVMTTRTQYRAPSWPVYSSLCASVKGKHLDWLGIRSMHACTTVGMQQIRNTMLSMMGGSACLVLAFQSN